MVVVSDPYKDIDYDKINVYEIDETYCEEDCMHVWSAEGLSESESEPEPIKETNKTDDVFIPFNLDYLYK